jgi:short-subunit dehydrogenase
LQRTFSSGKKSTHKVALITGATSGIGRAFAFEFARQQHDLILTGRRKEVLDHVAEELRSTYPISVEVIIADLTDDAGINRLIQVIENQSRLEVLVNNAGYGIGSIFHKDDIMDQLKMIKVHNTAPLLFIHKALPMMIERKKGTIINVSSLAAFTPARTNIMYTSTKAFILNFSESLYIEAKRHGIRIQCLCPGYTRSDFHARIAPTAFPKSKKLIPWMEPGDVVRYSIQCLDRGKIRCIPGLGNRILVMLISFAPRRIYYYFAARMQQEISGEKKVRGRQRRLEQTRAMG